MNYRTMSHVCSFFEKHGHTRKHMDDAVFLNITSVGDNYLSPVAANGGSRTYITILSNNNIAGYCGLRMNERGRINYGDDIFERVNHSETIEHGCKIAETIKSQNSNHQ